MEKKISVLLGNNDRLTNGTDEPIDTDKRPWHHSYLRALHHYEVCRDEVCGGVVRPRSPPAAGQGRAGPANHTVTTAEPTLLKIKQQ